MKTTSFTVKSTLLVGNALGDKADREVIAFTPDNPKNDAPLIIGLPSFGNDPDSFIASSPLTDSFPTILNRLYSKDLMRGSTVAIVDSNTKLGGNYFLNSTAVGQYENFIVKELVPELKKKFASSRIGLFGKGSGGFGAYTLAVRNSGIFNGFAAHSMDAGFENVFIPDFSDAMEEFRSANGAYRWLEKYWQSFNRISSRKIKVLRILCASSFLSPDVNSGEMGVMFPFDYENGDFRPEVWNIWQKLDPAKNVKNFTRQLESMNTVFIDAGSMDEFSAIWGARAIDNQLKNSKINHTYEEFEDGHFGINYRFEKSLPVLAQSLA